MHSYRLVALDVDGTVVKSGGQVSVRVREAVRNAMRAGITVTLATGRRYALARPVVEELGIEAPLILHNGAALVEAATGHLLHGCCMSRRTALGLLDLLRQWDMCAFVYHHDGLRERIYYDRPGARDRMVRLYPDRDDAFRYVPDLTAACRFDPLRMVVWGGEEGAAGFLAGVRGADLDCRVLLWPDVTTEGRLLEIYHRTSSKGYALSQLGKRLGVGPEATVAVGDHVNDVEMIRYAGLGVAMGNAPAEVKAEADLVTGTNDEDGVAFLLEDLVAGARLPLPRCGS